MTTRKTQPPNATVTVRRGPKGRRGEVADQILSAARSLFSTRGFAGTTVRAVAVTAGVDQALVTYYFSNKVRLLEAAVEPPEGFIAAAGAAAAAPLPRRGRALVETMLEQWEDHDSAEILRSAILTAAHEPVAMQALRAVFTGSLLVAVSGALADEERVVRAGLVASQMIGLAMARYMWRVGALAEMTPDDVIRYVAPTIQRYLAGRL